jgi:hypothetical protein
MRSAATAAGLMICVLALGGHFNSAATAGVLDPLDTVTSDLNAGVTDSVTGATDSVTDATSGVTGATDSVTGATSGVTGAVNDAGSAVDGLVSGSGATGVLSGSGSAATSSSTGGSGSASSGDSSASTRSGKASNRGSPHTRFDRLPPRYETLLERIESGHHVRASVARLRALLASASPELRARIMRAIRMELRRLEKGGLTRREQAAADRLRRLLPAPGGAASGQLTQMSLTRFGPAGAVSLSAGDGSVQVAGATAASPPLADHPPANGEAGTTHRLPEPLFPLPSRSGPAYWLPFLLAAIAAVLLLVPRAPRRLIPSSVRGMVEVRGAEVSALAVTIGLIIGVGVAFLLQALP